ncbi:FERM, ARHGEF and pleckstrin domain-containing protein 2 isoform X2 [Hydra vulgaris]|uniref:FERM, ARHGEF and pleckstrin domain-containing protein 2 isoform X2 n=1 Tax=Hydra vulgaris TaxID=6087 RepID=A0ABM4B5W1_HYDVU
MNGDIPPENNTKLKKSNNRNKAKVQVALLDDTVMVFDVEPRSLGEVLIKQVNSHLNLDEAEYFGLQISSDDKDINECWLDPLKSIQRQVKDCTKVTFKFRVMFYTSEPHLLQEYTRYLFTLQVRRDLLDGRLPCSEDTGALMASYIVQGELGDFDPINHKEGYLTGFQFVPKQTEEVEKSIVNYHKSHKGLSAVEADQKMLNIARQLDMYGITTYSAQDNEGTNIDLAVYHMGIFVIQNHKKINSFSWGVIRKISFKKKKFLIKLRPTANQGDGNVISFTMGSRNISKGFWKFCLNHHTFFRLTSVKPKSNSKSNILIKRGSSYRYSGRTKKEITDIATKKLRCTPDVSADKLKQNNSPQVLATTPSCSTPHYTTKEAKKEFDKGGFSLYSDQSKNDNISEDSIIMNDSLAKNNIIKMKHEDSFDYSVKQVKHENSFTQDYLIKPKVVEDNDLVIPKIVEDNNLIIRKMVEDNNLVNENINESKHEADLSKDSEDIGLQFNVPSYTPDNKVIQNKTVFSKSNHWQYNISSISSDDLNNEDDNLPVQEYPDVNKNDVEIDIQLRNKVQDLYIQQNPKNVNYDSDSDASALTVEEEESAFEDDLSLPRSTSSSVSSMHKRDCLRDLYKVKNSWRIYNIAKEILLTERTYVKDLEVLTVSFRNVVERYLPTEVLNLIFDNIDPLYDFHCSLLAELEESMLLWESLLTNDVSHEMIQKIGDILHKNMRQIKIYENHIEIYGNIMLALEEHIRNSKEFDKAYKEFELTKMCYLSINSFLMKPVQRLLYYKDILERLTKEYGTYYPDAIDIKVAYEEVVFTNNRIEKYFNSLTNMHKLIELENDLVGIDGLVCSERIFIREGCLYKICRKGPQPRMFFLLSDILLYTSQGLTASNHFKARSLIPLWMLKVEEDGIEWHGLYAFTLTMQGESSFVVAAKSPEERQKWMEDLNDAIQKDRLKNICSECKMKISNNIHIAVRDIKCQRCKNEIENLLLIPPSEHLLHWQKTYPSLPIIQKLSLETDSDDEGSFSVNEQSSLDRYYSKSTRHICWHRNMSINMHDYTLSMQNSLSGVLLRKLKNSNKWQRLWVVFTNFCLYFFKTYEDEAPTTTLPVIGYTLCKPSENELHDELGFQLQFKTRIYYFRAETDYAYERWTEVIGKIAMQTLPSKQKAVLLS